MNMFKTVLFKKNKNSIDVCKITLLLICAALTKSCPLLHAELNNLIITFKVPNLMVFELR
jgi:hypothetical protein